MEKCKELPAREQIAEVFKWRLEDLFETDEAWEKACETLNAQTKEVASYAGMISRNAECMAQYLQKCDEAEMLYERIVVYSNEKMHQDMGEAKYQGYAAKAQTIGAQLMEAEAFFEPELLEMDEVVLAQFQTECEELAPYKLLIERVLRKKEHTLSRREEELLAKTYEIGSTAQDVFMLFNNADLKFGEIKDEEGNSVELTHGRFIRFMESGDREVRKNAFLTLYHKYGEYKNTLAATYLANLKKAKFYADVRKYPSALAASLDESHIPEQVYENLIDTVHSFLPAMYRYVALRKKVLGVKELHMYDVYARLTGDYKMEIPYDKAKEMVLAGLAPLGEEYVFHLKEGFSQKWIDVYENKGKRSGAYSWGAYGTHPYVLLNYGDKLDDVFTLAHEMGHALHTYYSSETQPYTYSNYRIFVAEVASTCNESLLMQHLLKQADKQEKIYLLNYFIDQFKGTIFRQTMFAEFEKITHDMYAKGEAVTVNSLCEVYMKLNKLYFGEEMVSDVEIGMEWARIPHFYNEFYVYQYATGFSAAIALSKRILNEGEKAVEDYKTFLKGGCSKDPIELLKTAGVDLSSPEPIRAALSLFEELIAQLEALL